ncbi:MULTISPECIES: ABC transporter ATP-binding protein [unclassified Paracoccus (in: a-proteobacteria)]|uniref:ABC transporter ATP-binding protein n=1 Tax=unclassified Paracoccus (in: a-proteobacteria) TaxID=2688777 RepID=UPI001E614476|nr:MULTISPECIES: ABC transporter ATP-binding protein [unclassified Paracoccus (in: a-proteobacteria)]UXU75463.1 ABC transporter ATP-binding protein [Paracoccus sp. SMMA_5]UXU81368.1 ABC transporter ATP-binding protein [Paracoccus sp. SMMA_5_TC]
MAQTTALRQFAQTETQPLQRRPVIEINGAEKTFGNGFRALEPVDLTVREGEFLTLIGPSGCGKSTLLGLMTNLLQPSAGQVKWWGDSFERTGTPGKSLSIVFQDATLMPWASIEANVRLPLDLAGVPRSESTPRVRAALEKVGLKGFGDRLPRQLSGGMRMRVSIARSLVTEPDLLLMDEPFGALDEFTRNKLDADLLDLWRERNLSIVFVTHSIYEAVFLSSRVVVMAARPGRISRIIDIDVPGPRDEEFRGSPRFAALCAELSAALREASDQSGSHPQDE